MPKISVLLPVHNAARFLPAALGSIVRQDLQDAELVLVDDGSTDGSFEVAQRATAGCEIPLKLYRFRYNLGVTKALQFGFDRCDCQYVARQDADDVSLPGRLRFQAEILDNNPQVVALGTRVWILDEAGVPIRRGARMRWMPKAQMWIGRNPVVHGSLMARRKDIERVGGYRSIWEQAQDLDLLLRLGQLGSIKILPYVLYGLRTYSGQISAVKRKEQAAFALLARWANR